MLPQYLPLHNVETPHGLLGTGQLKSRGRCAVALAMVCACFSVCKYLVALVQLCYWGHRWILLLLLLLLLFIVLSKTLQHQRNFNFLSNLHDVKFDLCNQIFME